MTIRRRGYTIRHTTSKQATGTIYSFSSFDAYLRWSRERNEGHKRFDVSETWRDKKDK